MPLDDRVQELLGYVQPVCHCQPVGEAAVRLAIEVEDGVSKAAATGDSLRLVIGDCCIGEVSGDCRFVRLTTMKIADEIVDLVHTNLSRPGYNFEI
jgi:hypothetical protein